MSPSDTSEKGLEALIVAAMTGGAAPLRAPGAVREPSALYGGTGWILGDWRDYDREFAVDLVQLLAFLRATQPDLVEALGVATASPVRQKFLARLQGEITKRGVIHVLRHGVKHGPHAVDLFYETPTPGNVKAEERYAENRFSVTRQLRYSRDETQLALDLARCPWIFSRFRRCSRSWRACVNEWTASGLSYRLEPALITASPGRLPRVTLTPMGKRWRSSTRAAQFTAHDCVG